MAVNIYREIYDYDLSSTGKHYGDPIISCNKATFIFCFGKSQRSVTLFSTSLTCPANKMPGFSLPAEQTCFQQETLKLSNKVYSCFLCLRYLLDPKKNKMCKI